MNVNITWLQLITLLSMAEATCNSKVPLEEYMELGCKLVSSILVRHSGMVSYLIKIVRVTMYSYCY